MTSLVFAAPPSPAAAAPGPTFQGPAPQVSPEGVFLCPVNMVVEGHPMDATTAPPNGTVTFLFTDIEGHTRLWEHDPEAMRLALTRHDLLLTAGIQEHGGQVVKSRGEGDSFFAVFPHPTAALAAAAALQQVLQTEPWPTETPLRVRMAIHVAPAELREGDYFGPGVIRCARLRAVAHGGQVLLSEATADRVRDHLPVGVSLRDLGSHRLKDLQEPEQIFQLLHPDLPADFPPLRSLEAFAHNLPRQLTSFIGRERQMAEVKHLLSTTSLLTLTGAGGCGKTRLALQVAAELLDDFADGVFFVDLAPIRDPDLVVTTIAQVLGVQETGGQPLVEALKGFLREKQLLLVLDNFEQVTAAAPMVAELLSNCPELKVLVTSREVLRVRGEQEFPVPPLSVPDPKQLPPVEGLCKYASVALFLERAASARPHFTITNENATAVVEICLRLEGLPLAIELAAARVRLFTPEALLSRLGSRLKVLTRGARDLPARQQTLRDAIAWSYDLLDEDEKRIFRRLSVAVGGCTLETAEVLANAASNPERDALDVIASLVDKSLLRQDEGRSGEPRLRMLETIREYGRERLTESGEEATLRRGHAQHFLELAEEADPKLPSVERAVWMDQLAQEHDNLRAGLAWSLSEAETGEIGLRLAAALRTFWYFNGDWGEGRGWLERALAHPEALERSDTRAKLLQGAGMLRYAEGDFRVARSRLEESLAIYRALDDQWNIARVLACLGCVARDQGEYEAARSFFEQSLEIGRALDDKQIPCGILYGLADVALYQGDLELADCLVTECLSLGRELGQTDTITSCLNNLAESARLRGDYQRALALFEESLSIAREREPQSKVGSKVGWTLYAMGQAVLCLDDPQRALSLCHEGLTIRHELGDKLGSTVCLEGLAGVYAALGQPERAARLLGTADAQREALGARRSENDRVDYERHLAAARDALGEAGEPRFGASGSERQRRGPGPGFTAAWTTGRALPLERAVVEALGEAVPS